MAKKTLSFDKANAEAKVDALGNVIEEKPGDDTKDMSEKDKKKEIKNLQKQNIAVLLISHRLPDVMKVCDRIVVMRLGEKVCDKPKEQSNPEEITGLITGAIKNA